MHNDLFQKIEQSKRPDFSNILSKSFDLFGKIWMECLKHGLISLAIAIPFLLLIFIPLFPMYADMLQASINGYNYEPDLGYSIPFVLGFIIMAFLLSFIIQIFNLSITAHFYRVCRREDLGSNNEVGGYFDDVKINFGKLLVLSLAIFGIAVAATLLCYLPLLYVMVPLQLVLPIYAFNSNLSVSDIIKASFKLGNKYWLIIFGLVILSSIIAQLGILLCFIGVFITAFFVHLPMYYTYKDTIGFEEDILN